MVNRRYGIACAPILLLSGCQGLNAAPGASPQGEDIWAIRCITIDGPNRLRAAQNYADALRKVKGLRPEQVQVVDEAGQSSLFYGRYRRTYDAVRQRESYQPDPRKDLELIRQLSFPAEDAGGGARYLWPFHLATLETLPTARGELARWELTNAAGYYSLQVAVFYDVDEFRGRRLACEQYCKLLREQGEEAYFLHGPAMSIVCVGSFPKQAIQSYQETDPFTGRIKVSQKIVDPKMLDLQRKYPHNLHNGRIFYEIIHDPQTGQKIRDPHVSFPVEIPHPDRSGVQPG